MLHLNGDGDWIFMAK